MNKRKDKDWLKIYWCGTMIQILLICIIRFCLKVLTVSYPDYLNFLFIAVGGTSSAVWGSIVAKKTGKVQRYRQIIKYFFQIKQSMKYYVIVLCFLLILFGPSLMTGKVAEEVKWYSFIMIFIMAIVFGGIEEIGWRYIFQPLLEKRLPYEIASIITFVSWGLWHYMYFYVSDSLEGIQHISFLFGLLTSCFVLGAIYRISNSLWLCVLYHCLFNTFSQTLVVSEMSWSWISNTLCIMIAIVIGRKKNIVSGFFELREEKEMYKNFEQYQMTDDKKLIKEHSKDIKALLSQSYWAKERTLEKIEKSLEQSLCFAVFDMESNQIIGFARVVTDYATMYYLCDVIVDERHRGKQIGKTLVNWIVSEEKLKGMYGMLLTSDAQGLYSQYGFSEYQQSCMCKFK